MARHNELGTIRRSQIITTFGPGAVVDFRAGGDGGAPISAVVAGLDQWDESARVPGLKNPATIHEPRLEARLRVKGFRMPPVAPQDAPGRVWEKSDHLVAFRFPQWLKCPRCSRLKWSRKWAREPGDPARYCGECSAKAPGNKRVHVVPVGFITACRHGHLDEFPWHYWVGHKEGCQCDELVLRNEGRSGLSGLTLRCPECGAHRSMEGCFSADALGPLRCRGLLPWLGSSAGEPCHEKPRVLQRGASNLYFPLVVSAIDIPPWSDRIQYALSEYWNMLVETEPARRLPKIEALELGKELGMSDAEVCQQVEQRIALLQDCSDEKIRLEEYKQLRDATEHPTLRHVDFEAVRTRVPEEISRWVDCVTLVKRLREVRVLTAFTRIVPPSSDPDQIARYAPLQTERKSWLPGIEVRGEGIFVSLRQDALAEWEGREEVRSRGALFVERYQQFLSDRFGVDAGRSTKTVSARSVLVHSLAHALMRQLALDCGYTGASLRERLFIRHDEHAMAGFMIYTATPDADGTLGGLVSQGMPDRLGPLFLAALDAIRWCSSDPLCIMGKHAISDSLSWAACHSCMLVSETSCEEHNRLLDRSLLVGAPDAPGLAFFT